MERRCSNRIDTRVAWEPRVSCRTFATQLYDLSPTGCRIDCTTMPLARGDRIVFKFNDRVKVTGKVAWWRGGTAGVQFSSEFPKKKPRHFRCEPAHASS